MYLVGYVVEVGWCVEDDCIVVGEFVYCGDWCGLVDFYVDCVGLVDGNCFWYVFECDFDVGY